MSKRVPIKNSILRNDVTVASNSGATLQLRLFLFARVSSLHAQISQSDRPCDERRGQEKTLLHLIRMNAYAAMLDNVHTTNTRSLWDGLD